MVHNISFRFSFRDIVLILWRNGRAKWCENEKDGGTRKTWIVCFGKKEEKHKVTQESCPREPKVSILASFFLFKPSFLKDQSACPAYPDASSWLNGTPGARGRPGQVGRSSRRALGAKARVAMVEPGRSPGRTRGAATRHSGDQFSAFPLRALGAPPGNWVFAVGGSRVSQPQPSPTTLGHPQVLVPSHPRAEESRLSVPRAQLLPKPRTNFASAVAPRPPPSLLAGHRLPAQGVRSAAGVAPPAPLGLPETAAQCAHPRAPAESAVLALCSPRP